MSRLRLPPVSDPSVMEDDHIAPRRRGIGWGGVILGLALILALLGGFVFYQLENLPFRVAGSASDGLERWAGKVRDAFVAVAGMQPRVTVNEHVVYEQSKSVLELAVLEREATVERETEESWMGSTKHLRVRGLYRIKAGYDLTRPFSVRLDGDHADAVQLHMPRPRLLSVELERLDVLTMDSGLWNPVQPADFEQEVNMLNLEARQKVWREGTAAETDKMFTAQLQEKLGSGHRLEIVNDPPEPTPRR